MEKVKDHFSHHRVKYVGIVGVVGLHLWWKLLQDYGPGDRGRDYPHKTMVPVLGGALKKKVYGPGEDETNKET